MGAPRLSSKQKNQIVNEYASGVKSSLIASRFGIDPSYPGLLARRRKIPLRRKFRKANKDSIFDLGGA